MFCRTGYLLFLRRELEALLRVN